MLLKKPNPFLCESLTIREDSRQVVHKISDVAGENDFALGVQCGGDLHPAGDYRFSCLEQLGARRVVNRSGLLHLSRDAGLGYLTVDPLFDWRPLTEDCCGAPLLSQGRNHAVSGTSQRVPARAVDANRGIGDRIVGHRVTGLKEQIDTVAGSRDIVVLKDDAANPP